MHKRVRAKRLADVILVVALSLGRFSMALGEEPSYHEQFRPQVHYSPPSHWMNDPNGLLRLGAEYQMYFQYHPYSMVWGPMHWGHATSKDLVRWTNQPIALEPDERGAIFSGSAVYDRANSSGLARDGVAPVVAIYTYHDHAAERAQKTRVESQGLAYSLDGGTTFKKRPGVVLKNPGKRDFRDPKVMWFSPTRRWIMTLVATDHVEFYSSKNLKVWRYESQFGMTRGAHGGVWECPDLVRLIGTNDGLQHDILLVSSNPGGPAGGGGTQYFIGSFDGHEFRESNPSASPRWLDYGPDYYAAVSWNRDAESLDSPPTVIGWMSDWRYALKVPTSPWRSAMSIPRKLTVVGSGDELALTTYPIDALHALQQEQITYDLSGRPDLRTFGPVRGAAFDWQLQLKNQNQSKFEVVLSNASGQQTRLSIDPIHSEATFDRSNSGIVNFDSHFADLVKIPWLTRSETTELRIIVDQSSIEIFIDGGRNVITGLVFPDSIYDRVQIAGDNNVEVSSATLAILDSIWAEPKHN